MQNWCNYFRWSDYNSDAHGADLLQSLKVQRCSCRLETGPMKPPVLQSIAFIWWMAKQQKEGKTQKQGEKNLKRKIAAEATKKKSEGKITILLSQHKFASSVLWLWWKMMIKMSWSFCCFRLRRPTAFYFFKLEKVSYSREGQATPTRIWSWWFVIKIRRRKRISIKMSFQSMLMLIHEHERSKSFEKSLYGRILRHLIELLVHD